MSIVKQTDTSIPSGLTEATAEVFHQVATLKSIKGLYLCGGTAQSIQTGHRLSEDLDFELIGVRKERPNLDFPKIIKEIREVFPDAKTEILGDDQFHVFINNSKVKLSFYRPGNPVQRINEGYKNNNLVTPDLQDLLGMKLYTLCVREKYRDYYDIYCLLKDGFNLKDAIAYASYLSRHTIRSKTMLTRLLSPQLFPRPKDFGKFNPKYDVTPQQIKEEIEEIIKEEFKKKTNKNTQKL